MHKCTRGGATLLLWPYVHIMLLIVCLLLTTEVHLVSRRRPLLQDVALCQTLPCCSFLSRSDQDLPLRSSLNHPSIFSLVYLISGPPSPTLGCHSVVLIVHLLSVIHATCSAHFRLIFLGPKMRVNSETGLFKVSHHTWRHNISYKMGRVVM